MEEEELEVQEEGLLEVHLVSQVVDLIPHPSAVSFHLHYLQVSASSIVLHYHLTYYTRLHIDI